jgi:hypothetical protein
MRRLFLLNLIVAAACASPRAPDPGANPGMELHAAMQSAQAAASRPGDQSLSCEALQAELGETMKDPAIQSFTDSAAQQAAPVTGAPGAGAPGGAASALLGSVLPGVDAASTAAMAAQAPAMQAQTQANVQARAQQAQAMTAMLPQMMRGQRLIELAQARNCDWLSGAMPR